MTPRKQGKVLLVLYEVSCSFLRELSSPSMHTDVAQGGIHAKQQPQLLGCTENELGLRKWLEEQGHELVTTSDKDRENSIFDQNLVDAEVIITTPCV